MLKIVNISTKCAEIHCNALVEPQFSILCICGISIPDYDAFRQHFYSKHLDCYEEINIKPDLVDNDESFQSESLLVLPSPTTTEFEYDMLTTAPDSADANWNESCVEPKRRSYKPRNKPNACNYCGRTFRRRYLLDTHLNIHTGSKPHLCDMCGKQFRAASTLSRHLRTHDQRQALHCKHCDKLFTHRSALISHEMRHTQVRRWACESCGKCFYTPNQMDTHRRKLHPHCAEKSTAHLLTKHLPFVCELCDKSYRSASMLSTHRLKKHHRLAKYSCEQCDQKFIDADRLQQHEQIHVKPEFIIK